MQIYTIRLIGANYFGGYHYLALVLVVENGREEME